MYAIIQTGGKQYWVQSGDNVKVEKLDGEAGTEVKLQALWGAAEGVEGGKKGTVTAKIVRQFRAPKVIVYKKRPKKGYAKFNGHRQNLTEIKIENISL